MQLNLDSIWLREPGGPSAFFPDDARNSRFDFTADVGYMLTTLCVEGSPVENSGGRGSSGGIVSSVCPGGANKPSTSSVIPIAHGSSTKKSHVSLKILQAHLALKRGGGSRPEFRVIGQDFFDITEYTANAVYLNHAVKEKWGVDYTIVTSDGMKIQDSSGTQGLKFWKVGARKIYAVKQVDLKKTKRKYPADTSSSDSEEPRPKVAKLSPLVYSDIDKNLKTVKTLIESLFSVEKTLNVPLSMRKLLLDNFKCAICQSIIKPPAIFSKCCKCLLGCQSCVDTWYTGEGGLSKTCPRCRAERGYADTCRFNGLDGFLESVGNLLSSE